VAKEERWFSPILRMNLQRVMGKKLPSLTRSIRETAPSESCLWEAKKNQSNTRKAKVDLQPNQQVLKPRTLSQISRENESSTSGRTHAERKPPKWVFIKGKEH